MKKNASVKAWAIVVYRVRAIPDSMLSGTFSLYHQSPVAPYVMARCSSTTIEMSTMRRLSIYSARGFAGGGGCAGNGVGSATAGGWGGSRTVSAGTVGGADIGHLRTWVRCDFYRCEPR